MGLLKTSTLKQNEEKEQEQEKKSILVTTTDDIPGRKYEVLGLVTADVTIYQPYVSPNLIHVSKALQKEAEKLGADAIIGFRATVFTDDNVIQTAYGTAIRFLEEDQGGE